MVILPQSCFTCGDEVAWGGQIQTAGKVKSLVTSTTIRVELKGKEAYEVNDFRWFVVLSNSDWPVRVGERDRRYYVVSTSNEYRGDTKYWNRLHPLSDDPSFADNVYTYLLNFDIRHKT